MITSVQQSSLAKGPTNAGDETDIITFYNEQSSLARYIPKNNVLIIGGDINASIGKNGNSKFS